MKSRRILRNFAQRPVDNEAFGLLFSVDLYPWACPHVNIEILEVGDFDWCREVGTRDRDFDYRGFCRKRGRHTCHENRSEHNTYNSFHFVSLPSSSRASSNRTKGLSLRLDADHPGYLNSRY